MNRIRNSSPACRVLRRTSTAGGASPAALFAVLVAGLFAPGWLRAEPSVGGQFSLEGGPLAGGGTATAGSYALLGSASPNVSDVSRGDSYQLSGMLLPVGIVSGDLAIEVAMVGTVAVLSWNAGEPDLVLESTAVLGEAANWQPVTPAPAGHTYPMPLDQPLRFYRLRRR